MRSFPDTACSVPLSMTHRDTNAPIAPCARVTPEVLTSSWFINNVNVPSPLSNAPRPSGMPTIRNPSTESPTLRIDVVSTDGIDGNTYGVCNVLGPIDWAAPMAPAATIPATVSADVRRVCTDLLMMSRPGFRLWSKWRRTESAAPVIAMSIDRMRDTPPERVNGAQPMDQAQRRCNATMSSRSKDFRMMIAGDRESREPRGRNDPGGTSARSTISKLIFRKQSGCARGRCGEVVDRCEGTTGRKGGASIVSTLPNQPRSNQMRGGE